MSVHNGKLYIRFYLIWHYLKNLGIEMVVGCYFTHSGLSVIPHRHIFMKLAVNIHGPQG